MNDVFAIDENTWRIEDAGVRFFLLAGEKYALMIDTGMTAENALEIAEAVTRLPVKLINTHADPDHVSGNDRFPFCFMCEEEIPNYREHGHMGKVIPVADGELLDLGGRTIRVIHIPGHTPGSIALLDVENRRLFAGDTVQDGNVFMFGARRNMEAYLASLKKLQEEIAGAFDTIYASHGSIQLPAGFLPELLRAAEEMECGEIKGEPKEFMGRRIMAYDTGCAVFLCENEERREIK